MSETGKAVFLSYASQDAEAAKRICDALRAAGAEVWFDSDGGLEHGDEWDAKIRRQIKECVLFIPVISANTQAREEGYFRLEWDLAAERARTIASGVPFILPVVIDDTKESAALVPDRFRAVQWTRLRGGEVLADVQQRFLKLWSHRTGVITHEVVKTNAAPAQDASSADAAAGKAGVKTHVVIAAAVTVLVAGIGWWLLGGREPAGAPPSAPAVAVAPTKSGPAPASLSEARQLGERARAFFESLDSTPEDYKLAEELIAQAKTKDATDAEVWAAEAQLHQLFIERGWSNSPARREAARTAVQRAIRLDPNSFEARRAQAGLLSRFGREGEERERQLRELRRERPGDKRVLRSLAGTLDRLGRGDEAVVIYRESAALPGGDPLALYSLSQFYWFAGRANDAEKVMEEAIAQKSFSSALLMSVWYRTTLRGDIVGARKLIEQIDPAFMHEDRAAIFAYTTEIFARNPDRAIAWLQGVSRDWLTDSWYTGPKGMLLGDAHQLAGRADAATLEWRTALSLVDERLVERPKNASLLAVRLQLLAKLGQRDLAESQYTLLLQFAGADLSRGMVGMRQDMSRYLIPLGRKAEAIRSIESFIMNDRRWSVVFPSATLRLDPLYDSLRGDPEFARIIAEVEAREKAIASGESSPADNAAAKADSKSVAVLAFANLSDDKANEYFSDGISEELLNVLAKVPGLKVTARTSAFYFKGKEVPIPEIARQLGVAYVVEGSVRKAGDKVRITAQLIKAADGFHVWSDTFTRDLKDIFAVQDEIAGIVAKNLQIQLAVAAVRSAIEPALYERFLEARALTRKESNADSKQAIRILDELLRQKPDWADAWAEQARTYVQLGRFGGMPINDAMREARRTTQRALELDPDNVTGLVAQGWVQRTADWDWRGADASFKKARALFPGNAGVMADAAVLSFNLGRVDEAIALARQAASLDPLSARVQGSLGFILGIAGHFEESLVPLNRAVELAPAMEEVHSHITRALMSLRRLDEAERVILREPNEAYRLIIQAGLAYQRSGREEFDRRIKEVVGRYGDEMPTYVAIQYALTGDADQTFAWLDRAHARRDAGVVWCKTNAYLQSIRGDPRWPVFLRKMGLSDDQLK